MWPAACATAFDHNVGNAISTQHPMHRCDYEMNATYIVSAVATFDIVYDKNCRDIQQVNAHSIINRFNDISVVNTQ